MAWPSTEMVAPGMGAPLWSVTFPWIRMSRSFTREDEISGIISAARLEASAAFSSANRKSGQPAKINITIIDFPFLSQTLRITFFITLYHFIAYRISYSSIYQCFDENSD